MSTIQAHERCVRFFGLAVLRLGSQREKMFHLVLLYAFLLCVVQTHLGRNFPGIYGYLTDIHRISIGYLYYDQLKGCPGIYRYL